MAKIIVNCNNFTIEVENFETELYATAKVADSPGAKAEMDALTSRLERDIAKGKFKNDSDYR
jgi:hypothetical protein